MDILSVQIVEVGTTLPELLFFADPTFVVSTALATRDFQDVHHDRDKARPRDPRTSSSTSSPTPAWYSGSSPWAGPKRSSSRSPCDWACRGTPGHADVHGDVAAVDGAVKVEVVGRDSLGDHVVAKATLSFRRQA